MPSSSGNYQWCRGALGVGTADKAGKSVVRYWPGGRFTSAALRRPEKPREMIPIPQFSFPSEVSYGAERSKPRVELGFDKHKQRKRARVLRGRTELSLPHSSFHFHQALDCPPNFTHISFSSRSIFHPTAESGSPAIAQSDQQDRSRKPGHSILRG